MLTLAVLAGGAIGAGARFTLSTLIMARTRGSLPWGTLGVNVAGCVLIGILVPLTASAPVWRAFLVAGCTGAFTTFSTFAHDAVILLRTGRRRQAAMYAGVSITLGVAGVGAGLLLAHVIA